MDRKKILQLVKSPPALSDTPVAQPYYRLLEEGLWPLTSKVARDPDIYTAASLLAALLVPMGFWLHPLVGAFLMMASGLFDTMVEVAARESGLDSPLGAFLNSCMDRVRDFLFLFGFWVLFFGADDPLPGSGLIFSSFLLISLFNYTRTRATALGVEIPPGFMERGFRTIYLIFWAVLLGFFPASRDSVLWGGLFLFDLLIMAALAGRIVLIQAELQVRK
ncbi:MAG: CDP-alcohol phosphatidyltransferase family protein [Deltaproteobacteria bacterium]|nr:CDP-alcohol phosphatidyltransferase family protein [Deltaproteobacteria bacterium]